MGYSLCVVSIFANFQNGLIFPILAEFWSRFLYIDNEDMFIKEMSLKNISDQILELCWQRYDRSFS